MAPHIPRRPLAPLNPNNIPYSTHPRHSLFRRSSYTQRKEEDRLPAARHGGVSAPGQSPCTDHCSRGAQSQLGYGGASHACDCSSPQYSEAESCTHSRSDGEDAASPSSSASYHDGANPNHRFLHHGELYHHTSNFEEYRATNFEDRANCFDCGGIAEGFDHGDLSHTSPNYIANNNHSGIHKESPHSQHRTPHGGLHNKSLNNYQHGSPHSDLYKASLNYQHILKGLHHGGMYCTSFNNEHKSKLLDALLSPNFVHLGAQHSIVDYLQVQLLHSSICRNYYKGTSTCSTDDRSTQESESIKICDNDESPQGCKEEEETYNKPLNLVPLQIPHCASQDPYLDDIIDRAWHYHNIGEPLSPYTRLNLCNDFSLSLVAPSNSPSCTWTKWFKLCFNY